MTPSPRKMALWPALILFLICSALAANSQNIIALVGSGSNLPTPLYSHWVEEYNKLSPGVQVRYLSTGTVKGIEDISRGVGDFAAGEVPMSDEQLKSAKSPILHIPTVLVAIVPIYHVPGVRGNLRFSGPVLAEIFLGTIRAGTMPRSKNSTPARSCPIWILPSSTAPTAKVRTISSPIIFRKRARSGAARLARLPHLPGPLGSAPIAVRT